MPSAVGVARRIYDGLPAPLRRKVSLVPFGLRIGPVYRRTLTEILHTDRLDAAGLHALQTRELKRLLDTALANVPFYREKYSSLPDRDPWETLGRIEPVEKRDVQADPEKFLDRTVPQSSTYLTSTGGTTGQPLNVVLDKDGFQIEWAFQVAQWMRAGYRPGMRKATFRGVAFPGGRLWQENPVYDELQFSPFAMNERNLSKYVAELRRYRPDFLYGYPSALTILGKYVEAHGEQMPPIVALLSGSESLLEGQRELLERVFATRFYSWYGMSEKVILAGECERSKQYHAFPQYGITEILDDAGRLSSEPGAVGELVGTGFMNRAMPFIRYRTADHSEIVGSRCDGCGRNHLLLGPVHGRWAQEMIVGRSGAQLSLTALNMHGRVFYGIERFQFHQREKGRVTLRLVSAQRLGDDARARILAALEGKSGREVVWDIQQVERIDLSPRGKGVFLVQELPSSDACAGAS